MIEIIALYFITVYIGKLATKKGLPTIKWKINTILAWFAGEIVGVMVAILVFRFPQDFKPTSFDMIKISLVALPFAFAGFHIIKNILEKKPDANQSEF